jgi:hypothetical protein
VFYLDQVAGITIREEAMGVGEVGSVQLDSECGQGNSRTSGTRDLPSRHQFQKHY